MTIREILKATDHRPWPLPDKNWQFYQEWNDVIFLHWNVDLEELKKFVPKELEIDLYDDKPWVSIVAFTMEKIRPHYLPSFPPISNFDEINIRTYVKSKGKTGVYFLSIEGGNYLSCKLAKLISGLPYRKSQIKRNGSAYFSSNMEFEDNLDLEIELGNKLNSTTELDKWLIERYALFQDVAGKVNAFEIQHKEWQLNEITIKKLIVNYERFSKLLKGNPIKGHYSSGVQVLAWAGNGP